MDEYESLNHSKWECKYHAIFIPKCRRKTLYKELRQHLGEVFRRLAEQKQSRMEEGHLMPGKLSRDIPEEKLKLDGTRTLNPTSRKAQEMLRVL